VVPFPWLTLRSVDWEGRRAAVTRATVAKAMEAQVAEAEEKVNAGAEDAQRTIRGHRKSSAARRPPIEQIIAEDASGKSSSSSSGHRSLGREMSDPTASVGQKPSAFRRFVSEMIPKRPPVPQIATGSQDKKVEKNAKKKKIPSLRGSDSFGAQSTKKGEGKDLLGMGKPAVDVGSMDPEEVRESRPRDMTDEYMRPFLPSPSRYDHPAFAAHDEIREPTDHLDKVNTLLDKIGGLTVVGETPAEAAAREYERDEHEAVIPPRARRYDTKLSMVSNPVDPTVSGEPGQGKGGAAELSAAADGPPVPGGTGAASSEDKAAPSGDAIHPSGQNGTQIVHGTVKKLGWLGDVSQSAPAAIYDPEHRGYSASVGVEVKEKVRPPLLPGDSARRREMRRIMARARGETLAFGATVTAPSTSTNEDEQLSAAQHFKQAKVPTAPKGRRGAR